VNDLARGSGGPPSRRGREQRAYRLVVTGGVAGAIAVVGAVLAAVGVFGWAVPILAALIAVVCVVMFRRTVST
jgi:CHASE2 domain-containing sensor protein